MQKSLIKKGFVLVIVVLFIRMGITPSTGTMLKKSSIIFFDGNTLYVGGSGPGNYTKIQDAIDNTSYGDTIYVFDDSSPYYEYLLIEKSINLVGENRDTTIINGDNEIEQHIIRIRADGVNLHGFTVQNGRNVITEYYAAIQLGIDTNNNNIFGNLLTNNHDGIILNTASYNRIYDNIIIGSEDRYGRGITIKNGKNNEIFNNIISKIGSGIYLTDSPSNTIHENKIFNIRWYGIYLMEYDSMYNKIYNNEITDAERGISVAWGRLNFIYLNDIISCRKYGLYLHVSDLTFIFKNNFIENALNAFFTSKSYSNIWIRNYWDDWDRLRSYRIEGEDVNIFDPMGEYITVYQYDRLPARKPFIIG